MSRTLSTLQRRIKKPGSKFIIEGTPYTVGMFDTRLGAYRVFKNNGDWGEWMAKTKVDRAQPYFAPPVKLNSFVKKKEEVA